MSATYPVIAIDGPAASGKSTFGKALAHHLGYAFVSTGAMFRAVTWYLLRERIPLEDPEAVTRAMLKLPLQTELVSHDLRFLVAGIDATPHLRDASINDGVSLAAKVPALRHALVDQQRQLQFSGPMIMEGRDIGTVVFPETPYKFYLDADPEIRAARRSGQGQRDAVQKRDQIDQKRTLAPLICAHDAVRLDSGLYRVEELVEQALVVLRKKGLILGS